MGIWLHWSTCNRWSHWPGPKISWRLDPKEKFGPKTFHEAPTMFFLCPRLFSILPMHLLLRISFYWWGKFQWFFGFGFWWQLFQVFQGVTTLATSIILFVVQKWKGKDHLKEMEAPKYDDKGKTVGLLLCLLQSYFTSCCTVVLDSGFCVLKGIVELRKQGFFAGALIKKHQYWSLLVPGNAMDYTSTIRKLVKMMQFLKCLMRKNITFGAWKSLIMWWRLWQLEVLWFLMKVANKLQEGGLMEVGSQSKPIFNTQNLLIGIFCYRHIVDDYNKLWHSSPALEETWLTQCWAIHAYSFLLAITKVNLFLIMQLFMWKMTRKTL